MSEDSTTEQEVDASIDESRVENVTFGELMAGEATDSVDQANTDSEDIDTNEEVDKDQQNADEGGELDERDSDDDESSDEDFNPYALPDNERNAYFAQRRIAAKQQDQQIISDFREQVHERIAEDLEDVDYGDIPPEAAEQMRQNTLEQKKIQAEMQLQQVELNRDRLVNSFDAAESSIPLFNRGDKANYNEGLHNFAIEQYEQAYIETAEDANGNPFVIGVRDGAPTPQQYLENLAKTVGGAMTRASAKGQAAARRNYARVEQPSSSEGMSTSDNSIEALEERIGDLPLV